MLSQQGLRALLGQYRPDHPQPGQVVDILGLGDHLGDRNRRVSRGEVLCEPSFPFAELHPLRVHPQRRDGDRVARG